MTELPKTKKAVFYRIEKEVFSKAYQKGVFVLEGPRRVGKSTLLKQLCVKHDGYYFNVESLGCNANTINYEEYYESRLLEVLNTNSALICIDEITKMPKYLYERLSEVFKQITDKTVIVTGSIPDSVESFACMAKVKKVFKVNPLNYWEYCNWFNAPLGDCSYRGYLGYKQFQEITEIAEYAQEVLQDSINSYTSKFEQTEEMLEDVISVFNQKKFEDCIKLICLTGQMKLSSKGRFEDRPVLTLNLDRELIKEYERLSRVSMVSKKEIISMQKFLKMTGLGDSYHCYSWSVTNSNGEPTFFDSVTSYDKFMNFEFPCFGSAVFNELLTVNEFNFNHLCEVDVFNIAKEYFSNVGKFRDDDCAEIDFMSPEVLIEVKNSTLKQTNKHIVDYLGIAQRSGVNDLIITTSDQIVKLDTMAGIRVLRVNLPQLSYTLGKLQTIPNAEELLEDSVAEVLYSKIKGGI